MLTDPPPARSSGVDLLVIGALTLDRFDGGREEPGGSVLHVARSMVSRGIRLAVATCAGPEPAAILGVAELRQLAVRVEVQPARATVRFRHHEQATKRSLWLEVGPAAALRPPPIDVPAAVLCAPIAGEVDARVIAAVASAGVRGAVLQGWLRGRLADGAVQPLPLTAMDDTTVRLLGEFDLLVASREDLAAEARDAPAQLDALRARFGGVPVLAVTDAAAGAWFDVMGESASRERWNQRPPRRVEAVATVGAGDVFAAAMLLGGWATPPTRGFVERRATDAMQAVVEVLDSRRPAQAT